MFKRLLIIAVMALTLPGTVHATLIFSEDLDVLKEQWEAACVQLSPTKTEGIKCIRDTHAAVSRMKRGMASADRHPVLRSIAFLSVKLCVKSLDGRESALGSVPVSTFIAGCSVSKYRAFIRANGGPAEIIRKHLKYKEKDKGLEV